MIYLKIIELVILTLLPNFLWLSFFRSHDYHKEPLYILRRIFLFGFISTPLVGWIQWCANENIKTIFGYISSPQCAFLTERFISVNLTTLVIIIFLVGALIEELFKFFSMRLAIFGRAKKEFDEPVDSMIYLITAALGFSAAENLLYAISLGTRTGFFKDSSFLNYQVEIFSLIFLRSLATTLLHIISSGIFGYFFAKAYFHFQNTKFYFIRSVFAGLFGATLIHLNFNLIIKLIILNDKNIENIIKIFGISIFLFIFYIILEIEFKKLQLKN